MVTLKYTRFSDSIWNYINWAVPGLSLRHICMLINQLRSPAYIWNMINYAITEQEIERPSTKEKRPNFV